MSAAQTLTIEAAAGLVTVNKAAELTGLLALETPGVAMIGGVS